jgi:ribonuclease HIII
MEERTITITVAEYNELISDKLILNLLKTAIFSKAYKGYSGGLCFSDIEDIVSVIFPAEYTEKRVFLDVDKEEADS